MLVARTESCRRFFGQLADALDTKEFATCMEKEAKENTFVCLAVVGTFVLFLPPTSKLLTPRRFR